MKNQIMSLLIAIFVCTNVVGQNSEKKQMTLEDCVLYALKYNPNLRSAALDNKATTHQIKEMRSAALPQISANGQYMYNYALASQLLPGEMFGQPGTTIPVKFGVANSITAKIELQQVLFNKSMYSGLKLAKTSQSLVALNTFKTKEELVYNIAQLYLQLQITEKQKVILNANIDRINKLTDMAQLQFNEGLIKKVDVSQLVVNKINLETELHNIEIGVSQQENFLKFYMGMPEDESFSVIEYIQKENETEVLTADLDFEANTTLKLLNKQLEVSSLELKNINDGYYPSLSAFANYGWQGQTDRLFSSKEEYKIQGSPTGVVGVTLNVPIFDGLKKHHKGQQIKIKQTQMELDKIYLKNSIQMEFANAQNQLEQNKVVIEAQKKNIRLAEELYEVAKLSYQEGIAPLAELLNAETSLKEAQTQYLTALLQLNLAELDYMKTSGQLAILIKNSTK